MKDKYIIIIFAAAILLILLSIGAFSVMGNMTDENNTTDDVNLTLNETNDTNNTTTQTATKTTKNSKTSQKKSENDIYYDEELNLYFDSNGKTVYEGQVPKGTSKSELQKMASEIESDDYN